MSAAIANVMEKWEFLFRGLKARKDRDRQHKVVEEEEDRAGKGKGKGNAVYFALNRCDCSLALSNYILYHQDENSPPARCDSFEDLIPADEGEEAALGDADFAATLNEGTEKLVLHGQTMAKLLLSAREIKMLLYLLSSMVLSRNRLRSARRRFFF